MVEILVQLLLVANVNTLFFVEVAVKHMPYPKEEVINLLIVMAIRNCFMKLCLIHL